MINKRGTGVLSTVYTRSEEKFSSLFKNFQSQSPQVL